MFRASATSGLCWGSNEEEVDELVDICDGVRKKHGEKLDGLTAEDMVTLLLDGAFKRKQQAELSALGGGPCGGGGTADPRLTGNSAVTASIGS